MQSVAVEPNAGTGMAVKAARRGEGKRAAGAGRAVGDVPEDGRLQKVQRSALDRRKSRKAVTRAVFLSSEG